MLQILLPVFFIYTFSVFNLLGMKSDLLMNHLLYFGISVAAFFIIRFIGVHFFRHNAVLLYWVFVGILLVTYIVGFEAKGAQRWIDLYFFSFQPSEFFKIFFIAFFANIFSRLKKNEFPLPVLLSCIAFFIVPAFIIMRQPDLATTIVFAFMFITMLFVSPLPKKYFFYLGTIALLLLPILWYTSHDYQRNRILTFLDPTNNQSSTSYNMTQALITVGSGQLGGKGLGMGKQSTLYFLPEFHTDFAYSALVEQFGFIGGFVVIGLYMILSFFLIRKIFYYYRQDDELSRFKFYYTVGFFAFVFFQTFVNIGMNIGLLPIAGITLPLISYGGSSLVTFFIGLALLL